MWRSATRPRACRPRCSHRARSTAIQHVRRHELQESVAPLGSTVELIFGRAADRVVGRVAQINAVGKMASVIPLDMSAMAAESLIRAPRFTQSDVLSAVPGRAVAHIFGVSLTDAAYRRLFFDAADCILRVLATQLALIQPLLATQFGALPFTAEDAWQVIQHEQPLFDAIRMHLGQHARGALGSYSCLLLLRQHWSLFEPSDAGIFFVRSPAHRQLAEQITNCLGDSDRVAAFVDSVRQGGPTNSLDPILLAAVECLALSATSSRCRMPAEMVDRISATILTPLGLGTGHTAASNLFFNLQLWKTDANPTMQRDSVPALFRQVILPEPSPSSQHLVANLGQVNTERRHAEYDVAESCFILSRAEGSGTAKQELERRITAGRLAPDMLPTLSQIIDGASGAPGVVLPLLDASTGQLRKDLGDLLALAIDDPSTTEVDDALSVDGDDIYVHIADPTAFISAHSRLDILGRQRAETIYLPDKKLTMLPDVLATTSLSLRSGLKVPALTFKVSLAQDGSIGSFSIFPSSLNRVMRCTYDEVEQTLSSGQSANSEVAAATLKLWDIAQTRRKYRQTIGARLFNLPYVGVNVNRSDDAAITLDLSQQRQARSRRLVEEFMVLTGEIAGTFAAAERIPVPYRVQRSPMEVDPWTPPDGMDLSIVEIVRILREIVGFYRADTSVVGAPHHSLHFERYARCSSPIRRYSDMIVHHQLKSFLSKGLSMLPFDVPMLGVIAAELDSKSKQIRQIQRYAETYWKMQYVLRNGLGRTWRGIVIDSPDPTVAESGSPSAGARFYQVYILDLCTSCRVYHPRHLASLIQPGASVHMIAIRRSPVDVVFEITSLEETKDSTTLLLTE